MKEDNTGKNSDDLGKRKVSSTFIQKQNRSTKRRGSRVQLEKNKNECLEEKLYNQIEGKCQTGKPYFQTKG